MNKEEKIELVEKLKQQSYKEIKTYNFHNTHFYKFSSKFLDYNEIIKEFNEVFNLYKGILEFSFNKKSNFFFQMDERKNSSFQEHLELITSDKLSPDFKELLENCFRLYSMSIDVNTIDQSYLFIWNILESITLSQSGNTDECIKKVMTFCSKQFKEENKFNIETLKKLRNDRVHKGVGNIEISDLNMLKYLVDCSILFLLDNHQIVKNKQYLDVFFSLSENNLDKIKEMVEFKIEYKKQLNT